MRAISGAPTGSTAWCVKASCGETSSPHRHNPDDLVPVIRLPEVDDQPLEQPADEQPVVADAVSQEWAGMPPHTLYETEAEVARMVTRIVVSVQQFTSFRTSPGARSAACIGACAKVDSGVVFQQAVEYLLVNNMVTVNEYPNPRSDYNTKGLELDEECAYAAVILGGARRVRSRYCWTCIGRTPRSRPRASSSA